MYEAEKNKTRTTKLPEGSSVYTAEINSLNMAMRGVEKSNDVVRT